jgi:hypothetical protein
MLKSPVGPIGPEVFCKAKAINSRGKSYTNWSVFYKNQFDLEDIDIPHTLIPEDERLTKYKGIYS